ASVSRRRRMLFRRRGLSRSPSSGRTSTRPRGPAGISAPTPHSCAVPRRSAFRFTSYRGWDDLSRMSQAARDVVAPLEAKVAPPVRLPLPRTSARMLRELVAHGALLGVVVMGAAIVVLSATMQNSFGIARQESGAERWVVGPLAHHAATF